MSGPPSSSSPAPSLSHGTASTTSADELERPPSAPLSFAFDPKPPAGPKAWLARQQAQAPVAAPSGVPRAGATPPPPPPHSRHQPGGSGRGGRPFSPHPPHRPFLPQHQFSRPFNTASGSAPRGPWRHGDPIVFAGTARPGAQTQHLHPPTGPQQHVRSVSRSSAPALVDPPTAPRKRGRKTKTAVASDEPLVKIKELTGSVNEKLQSLQVEYAKLMLQSRYHGGADGIEACELAVDMMRAAELVAETANKAKEAIEADQLAVKQAEEELERFETERQAKEEADRIAEDGLVKPLEFHIPQEIMDEKLALEDGDKNKFWCHTHYTDNNGEKVTVSYCKTIDECEKHLAKYLDERVVGFDMEWCEWPSSKSARQNVAMIQIANESSVTLCHIGQMVVPPEDEHDETKLISPTLRKIIESENILKVGVNVTNDARRLRDYLFLRVRNIFELSDLHNLVFCAENNITKIPRRLVALARLTQMYLHLPLDKGPVRTSRWDKPITELQAKYAAGDAYVGLRIFHSLEEKRRALKPRPQLPPARIIDDLPAPVPEPPGSRTTAATITTEETLTAGTISLSDSSTSSNAKPAKPKTSSSKVPAPEFQRAAQWLETFQKTHPNAKAAKSQLRAYALWHVFQQDVDTVCRLWRDPPLKMSTVTGYIAEAIRLDSLPFDRRRFREEVYQALWRREAYEYLLLGEDGEEEAGRLGEAVEELDVEKEEQQEASAGM